MGTPSSPNRSAARLLALLVHRGLVTADDARQALGSEDPRADLAERGVVSAAQWDEWLATDAGARPKLNRYELLDLLGEGGQARVFRAVDRSDGSTVALKILKPEFTRDAVALGRFVAEAKLLMDLDDEHIVRGRRVAREGDVYFCAMEAIDGECLQTVIDRDGALDETTALRVVRQIAGALEHLHLRGFVHRDVKPGNIMLDVDGRAVLIDLGFAVGEGRMNQAADTTAGTVHYISPEQARGAGGIDVRADIYSLGATLFHLVTGSLPFAGATGEEVLRKQVLESLSGERIRALGLSQQIHWLIAKMMAKEKEIRFQSPGQLAAEIEVVLKQQEAAESDDAPARARRRRRRWL